MRHISFPLPDPSDIWRRKIVITRAVKGKDGAMSLGMPPACTRQALKDVPPAQRGPKRLMVKRWYEDDNYIDSLMTTPNSSIPGWTIFVHPKNWGRWTHFDSCIFFRWVEKNHQLDTEGMGLLTSFDCSQRSCWIQFWTPQTSSSGYWNTNQIYVYI